MLQVISHSVNDKFSDEKTKVFGKKIVKIEYPQVEAGFVVVKEEVIEM